MSPKSDLGSIMSRATVNSKLQNTIDKYVRMDNYSQHAVLGYSFTQEGSAFTIGGKIPRISFFNIPEIPIGLIYVQENYINSLPLGELEFIVLHELGHVINNHVVWNIVVFLTKEVLIDWLREHLGTSREDTRNLIGIVKLLFGKKTIEEELTAQKEFAADAYAVRMQGNKNYGMSVLQRLSNGKLDAPTHITQDGSFFNTAVTFRERIEAIERL